MRSPEHVRRDSGGLLDGARRANAEGLLSTPPTGTADPDAAIITSNMGHRAVERVKDILGAGKPPK